jgi:glycosyltransferase involved in cell wall biosynthesis
LPRVLHILDASADFQTRRGVADLCRALGPGFETSWRTIGPGGDWRGIASAVFRLRGEAGWDVVHAWGTRALSAAAMTPGRRIVFSPAEEMRPADVRWTRAVMGYRDVDVVCASDLARRRFVERGVPLDRCHLIRPGVDFGRIKSRRSDSVRAAMGLAADDYVVLAAGETTALSNHHLAAWAIGILSELDPKYKVLVWGRGRRFAAFERAMGHWRNPAMLRVATARLGPAVQFEELFAAADAIAVTAKEGAGTLPIAMAMAAALPIVAVTNRTTSELLEDRHTAAMVSKDRARLVARRILDVREDTQLQWSISDMARTEAYEYFSLTRFVNQWRTVYRQLAAGERAAVPEQQAGAGMRFHGRG